MKRVLTDLESAYLSQIWHITIHNQALSQLFNQIPEMTIETYKKSASIYATKKYDELVIANKTIPHSFYSIIEDSIKNNGLLKTIRTYDKELNLICEVMEMDLADLKKILLSLRPVTNPSLSQQNEIQAARAKLKEIIRRATSKFKERYIKGIITEKTEQLKKTTKKIDNTPKNIFSSDIFISHTMSTPIVRQRIESIIFDKLGIVVDEKTLKQIITATSKKNYKNDMTEILGIKKPDCYEDFLKAKDINRLNNNFAPKLNKIFKEASQEEKELILKILKYKAQCKKALTNQDSDEFLRIKTLIKKCDMELFEEISSVMVKANSSIELVNGTFKFTVVSTLTNEERQECMNYNHQLKAIRSIHNAIYSLYKQQTFVLNVFMNMTSSSSATEENQYQVDKDKWLNVDMVKSLIERINTDSLSSLSNSAFTFLKKFLIKDGLLWAYLAGNIELDEIAKIINNFQSIYSCLEKDKITIENISEIIKNANLYDYVDDISIGLVGLDILSKVINYNQFSGVAVTPDDIRKRIRKVIDLSVRSERTRTSSLPFNCDVKNNEYSLKRYHNNDPQIFTSGIDTKTCFFVSVNENDFFFFSLLHKDGYVIKIVDKDENLIARATCFRKNNVLLINGIRFINNKVIPDNQEDLKQFASVINLVQLMAKKIINITAQDECPIDYVVCNKAGILENDYFSNSFESINSDLFREPINVYSDYWDRFVHLYDQEEEQLLQEVPYSPNTSFTTDFGNHYPAIMIASRNNMGLTSPRNISLNDQPETYTRTRSVPEEYIGDEIDEQTLARINRIRALACFTGTKEEQEQKKKAYKLLKDAKDIKNIVLGSDWFIITLPNDNYITIYANETAEALKESESYISRIKKVAGPDDEDHDMKFYKTPSHK